MKSPNRRLFNGLLAATAATAALGALPASAQDAPARILVGFPAGGSFDIIARLVAEKVKVELNRPVVVDNRPGAGGRLAVDILKSSPADGSVVMLGPDALTALYPFTFRKLNYDPSRDLVPIGTVAEFPFAMAAGADPKVSTLAEYVAWAKQNPAKANYGIPAPGGPHHFFGLVLGNAIGVPMQTVPFQGSAPILVSLMGGQVTSAIDVMSSLTESHRAGKIRVLAVSSESRIPQAPDVPTFAEQGLPFEAASIYAILAPKATPDAVVSRLNAALGVALKTPEARRRLAQVGVEVIVATPAESAQRLAAEVDKWSRAIDAARIKQE